MDRQTVYPGQIPLETDLLNTNKNAMVALAKLAAAMFGAATVVNGLACVPTGPASLQVVVNPGEMYSLANIDATAYSSLPADTSHSILKQGISLDPITLSCAAPPTAGQSVNYLIQAVYQDVDTGLVTLPYYNASNPSQAWSGPGNTGAQQATARKGVVTISAKAGIAAATGTQVTPAPDAGNTGLWVVTVANGQTTITSANIAQAANAPILPADLLHAIQASSLIVGTDTGSANTYVVSYSPTIAALADGMVLWFKAKTANSGASTLNVNGLGAQPLIGGGHAALQGGEITPNGKCQAVWRADISSWVLLECTGGALQVAPATQAQHAAQFAQAGFRNQAIYKRIVGVQNVSINGAAFTTSGATTFPAPISGVAKYRIWAGGGGGGGSAGGAGALGGGGGGGGYNEGVATGLSSATAITVGAGGAGGTSAPTAGSQGGTSSFGAIASAFGGSGGQPQTSAGSAAPGGGSGGAGGVLVIPGTGGGSGFALGAGSVSGSGGGAFCTTAQQGPASVGSSGFQGIFPSGGATGSNNANALAGADGLVIVEY
ncbi:hypothetical protein [Cupriavidus campinensis]